MRDFNDISQNKNSYKSKFAVCGIQHNGAFHVLGNYNSVSTAGAIKQAKNVYGDKYKTYSAGIV